MEQFGSVEPQRMTDEEAQQVMRVLAERRQRREDLEAMPSVVDVAQMANVDPDEVASALAEVRAVAPPRQMPAAASQRRTDVRPYVFVGAFLAVLIAMMGLLMLMSAPVPQPPPGTPAPLPSPTVSDAPIAAPVVADSK